MNSQGMVETCIMLGLKVKAWDKKAAVPQGLYHVRDFRELYDSE